MKQFNIILLILISINLYSIDFTKPDNLHHKGNYKEELTLLKNYFATEKSDASLLWRIGRAYFEIAEQIPNKNKLEKIKAFNNGMEFLKPYIDIKEGDKSDRAKLVHWYTANFASKGNTIGAIEALSIVPELRALCDKALSIDPEFSDPYFILARIDDRLPGALGGDKVRMGINLSKALKFNSEDITVLVDSASAFYNRNWTIDKKKQEYSKKELQDPNPVNISDREYALELLKKSISIYKNLQDPSFRDTIKNKEANELLNKWS